MLNIRCLPKNELEIPPLQTSRRGRLLEVIIMLILASPVSRIYSQTLPDTTVIFPSADTYVRSTGADADRNFSNDSIIKARYSTSSAYHELGLLKYDLSHYPVLQQEVIDSVRLEMTLVYEQVAGAYVTILGVPDAADTWEAGTVTWNTGRPDTTGTIAIENVPQISAQLASTQGITIGFDITSRFINELSNGNQVLSLGVFTKKNAGANTYFLSSQSALEHARPKLVVYAHRKVVRSGIRNLNVIYFVPAGSDTVPLYKERLNGILYQAQNFYRKWMEHWGYGDRTFGLRSDSLGRVRIVVIHGAHEKEYYPYDGGGAKARSEIEAYFASHPQDKQSTHTLVMMPPNIDSSGKEDVPFYGIGGGWCFALDNPDIDTNYIGTSNYIGGMIHELGHGLNLPHVRQKVSELGNPAMGTSLMGSGNYTYRKAPTFLTESSCAILNNCEVFSVSQPSADLYQETSASLVTLHGGYSNGNIIVNGTYASSKPVNNIVVYNDPDGGSNYDRESWVSAPLGTDSFSVVMPISELHKKDGSYKLVVALLCGNGATKEFSFDYYFESSVPVIDIEVDNYIDTIGTKVYLAPVDDTYGIYADRSNVHGADSLIQVRYSLAGSQTYNKIGYLKFDLNQLDLPSGAVIKNILLQAKLQYHQVSSGYKIDALSIADGQDGWEESTLTWDNRPDTLMTVATTTNQPVGTYLNWVITDVAKAELNTGNHILSLGLYTELNSAANTWFYSKESANGQDHPRLLVVYTMPDEDQSAAMALPVHQVKLNAAKNRRQVMLKWTTYADDAEQAFLVQRSIDGKNFTTIGKVDAVSADVAGTNQYSFMYYEQRNGIQYYRIQAENQNSGSDTQRTYSNVTMLHLQDEFLADEFSIYPNPIQSTGRLTLSFINRTNADKIAVKMNDVNGKMALYRVVPVVKGHNVVTLDLSDGAVKLSSGIYFISLKYNTDQSIASSLKLIVQ